MKTQRRDEGFGLLLPWFICPRILQITGLTHSFLQDQSLKLKDEGKQRRMYLPRRCSSKERASFWVAQAMLVSQSGRSLLRQSCLLGCKRSEDLSVSMLEET